MSTVPTGEPSTTERLANLLFDYPGADIVLRFQDSHHIQVPKIYIVSSSPVLSELIQKTLDSPGNANAEEPLPVLQLSESGEILECLLAFVFPGTPRDHRLLKKSWNSYLWPKSIKWEPHYLTSGPASLNRTYTGAPQSGIEYTLKSSIAILPAIKKYSARSLVNAHRVAPPLPRSLPRSVAVCTRVAETRPCGMCGCLMCA